MAIRQAKIKFLKSDLYKLLVGQKAGLSVVSVKIGPLSFTL